MPSEFETALLDAATELLQDPGVGGHIHFDDPAFSGVVPDFRDVAWLELGREVASILATLPGRLLVEVPIGAWGDEPDSVVLGDLTELDPWQPPAFYALTEHSAHEHEHRQLSDHWYSDDVAVAHGAFGWLSAWKTSGSLSGPAWLLSLRYETKPTLL